MQNFKVKDKKFPNLWWLEKKIESLSELENYARVQAGH